MRRKCLVALDIQMFDRNEGPPENHQFGDDPRAGTMRTTLHSLFDPGDHRLNGPVPRVFVQAVYDLLQPSVALEMILKRSGVVDRHLVCLPELTCHHHLRFAEIIAPRLRSYRGNAILTRKHVKNDVLTRLLVSYFLNVSHQRRPHHVAQAVVDTGCTWNPTPPDVSHSCTQVQQRFAATSLEPACANTNTSSAVT